MLVNVAGSMTVASNCWVYPSSHDTNGGSVYFRVKNLTVNAAGGFDATAVGFCGGGNTIWACDRFRPGRTWRRLSAAAAQATADKADGPSLTTGRCCLAA